MVAQGDLFGLRCNALIPLRCDHSGKAHRCGLPEGHEGDHACASCGSRFVNALPPMVRITDPVTSHQAAAAVMPTLNTLQWKVLEYYDAHGDRSARQVEQAFPEYGFSTIRKRVSELHQMGLLVECGTETESGKTPAIVYRLSTREG